MSWEEFKNWLTETQTEADIFANTNDGTVAEIEKALRAAAARFNRCSTTPRPRRRSSTRL